MAPFIGPQPPTAAQMTAAATAAPGLSKLASAAAAVVAGVPLDAAEMAAVLKASRKEGQVKPTRTNWSKGENLQKMTAACGAWKNQTAPFVTGMTMSVFARVVQIPEKTLTPYLKGTKIVGKGQGAPSLLGDDHESFVCDVMCRQDQGQDGLTVAGCKTWCRPSLQTCAPARSATSPKMCGSGTASATAVRSRAPSRPSRAPPHGCGRPSRSRPAGIW